MVRDTAKGRIVMREKLQRFMSGRYGADELGKALSVAALVCVLLSMLVSKIPFLYLLLYWGGFGLLIYSCYRMFSKNVAKRYAENQKYRTFRYRMVTKWDAAKKRFAQRKTYRFFRCPQCKQMVRVPRGRGKICITCPKCRHEFIRKS